MKKIIIPVIAVLMLSAVACKSKKEPSPEEQKAKDIVNEDKRKSDSYMNAIKSKMDSMPMDTGLGSTR